MKTILKKTGIIIGIMLFFISWSLPISAQLIDGSKIGIKGGANLSNLFVKDVSTENIKVGWEAGFFLKAALTSSFAIQPELLYSTKGAELTYNNSVVGKALFSLNYVELPVLAVFNLSDNINLHVGPYLGYLTQATAANKTNGHYDFQKEVDVNNFKPFDWGVAAGIGFEVRWITLGLRYNYGLEYVGKDRAFFGQTYNFPKGRNSVGQVFIGFSI